MKKLMVTAVAVAMATVASAAQFKWSGANVYAGYTAKAGESASGKLTSGTAYLFDAATVSQSQLWTAFTGDDFDISKAGAIDHVSVSSTGGVNQGTAFEYGSTSTEYNMYFAIVMTKDDTDYIYMSNIYNKTTSGSATSPNSLLFSTQNDGKKTFSALSPSATGFNGEGHWSYAAVPEPTSGLLLLLGMAGLALRRKQK